MAAFIDWQGQLFRRVTHCVYDHAPARPEEGHTYVVGCDWARAAGGDYTVFAVLDAISKAVVAHDRSRGGEFAIQRARLQGLYAKWKPATILAEANSIGGPVIEQLQRDGLPVQPFTTTNQTKTAIIDALVLAFEQQQIRILNDAALISEVQSFTSTPVPPGCNATRLRPDTMIR